MQGAARLARIELVRWCQEVLGLRQHFPRRRFQRQGRGGGDDAARPAYEKQVAGQAAQPGQPARQLGLAHAQPYRGARDVQRIQQRDEGLDIGQAQAGQVGAALGRGGRGGGHGGLRIIIHENE